MENNKAKLVLDCEIYPNYFLASFKNLETGKLTNIEAIDNRLTDFDRRRLLKAMSQYTTISFNGNNFDLPVIAYALAGATTREIYVMVDVIINSRIPGWLVAKNYGLEINKFDHIDIIEPAPGVQVSLKLYGARLNSKKLQDLPIEPGSILTNEEMEQIKIYCENDLDTTIELYSSIKEEIDLRIAVGEKYKIDMRSKSGGQMATSMLLSDLKKIGVEPPKPKVTTKGLHFVLQPWMGFKSQDLKDMLDLIVNTTFETDKNGIVKLPSEIAKALKIGTNTYKMGIGGLHSQEKNRSVTSNDEFQLIDCDVASMYPATIINQGIYPKTVGPKFLSLYTSIRDERIEAKKAKDKMRSESLKLSLNSVFGLLGSKYSKFYDPQAMIQVTLSGQIALLMLIERLEMLNITVISANTDGITSAIPHELLDSYMNKCKQWEQLTGYELEYVKYKGMYSRDVNNYVAITDYGEVKTKGIFASPGLRKNTSTPIIYTAVIENIQKGVPLKTTIKECKDITKFLSSQRVTGGAVWKDQYLGKVVRWYYGKNGTSIHYKTNGNKVGKTDGSIPLMQLVDEMPNDIDFNWYIEEAQKVLSDLNVR